MPFVYIACHGEETHVVVHFDVAFSSLPLWQHAFANDVNSLTALADFGVTIQSVDEFVYKGFVVQCVVDVNAEISTAQHETQAIAIVFFKTIASVLER